MKGSRAIAMLLLSLVAGVAAVLLAARWLAQQADTTSRRIAVLSRDVDIGQPLDASMVELVPWVATAMPRGAFSDPKDLQGRVVISALQRGEPVLEARLAPVGARGGLSAVIPSGKRAITVKVNEVAGVAGFALPGSFVDVMVNTQDDQQRPVSKIVLERVLVLAVAQEASRDDSKPKVVNAVTLEVTPDHAERLDLARSVGTLSLVLRNQIDADETVTNGTRKADLLGERRVEPPQVEARVEPPAAKGPVPRPAVRRVQPRPEVATAPVPTPPPEFHPGIEVIRGVQRSTADL
ncbi:MAG: Flp pilus assembly CpaB precursor [Pseudomonadota bacterium]|jgi:pilus assembly protein CpaB